MKSVVHLERHTTLPSDAVVFHYDELDEVLKNRFPALIESTPTLKPEWLDGEPSHGDFIKFTDYYRIYYE